MKTKNFLLNLKKILKQEKLNETKIILVSDVMKWEHSNSLKENNPFRITVAARRTNSNIRDVIIQEDISEEDMNGIISAMDIRGFKSSGDLKNIKRFIIHTFLHEVAHVKGIMEELDADIWAFDKLKNYEPLFR